jgi:HNH endonuclease
VSRCELCERETAPYNASGWCAECHAIVMNRLGRAVDERWAPAVGQVDHIVSDRGRVARLLHVVGGHKYPRVSIGREKRYVHVMVAEAFHGPRPAGLLVLHHDDDPDHPHADNLRFGTHADNAADAKRNRASAGNGSAGKENTK